MREIWISPLGTEAFHAERGHHTLRFAQIVPSHTFYRRHGESLRPKSEHLVREIDFSDAFIETVYRLYFRSRIKVKRQCREGTKKLGERAFDNLQERFDGADHNEAVP